MNFFDKLIVPNNESVMSYEEMNSEELKQLWGTHRKVNYDGKRHIGCNKGIFLIF